MTDASKTLCPYCGVGCGLEVMPPARPGGKATLRAPDGQPIWQVRGDRAHPSSKGQVCVKGATVSESLHKDRLKYPMLRNSLNEPFRQVSWDEAMERLVSRMRITLEHQGPEGICMYGSGQFQTEDYYLAQKLLKGCLRTNNFDANSRLCMSSAVAGYIQSFGADGPPCCYDDLEKTDCAFLIGTNTAECHPIVFNRLQKYHRKNRHVKMIVVDPRETLTAKAADLHLAIRPGSDLYLLNGIAHLLLRWNAIDSLLIDECTTGYTDFVAVAEQYPPERVAEDCGIAVKDLEQAARYWAESDRVLSLWSMGINQSSEGTAKVRNLINLHLMTGNIGKPGAGPFSLTGQPNAMGGREAGGLAHILPGYRLVKDPQHRRQVEQHWGLPEGQISSEPGLAAWDMIRALEQNQVGVFWVAATNPAVSMPDLERTKAALLKSPFTVCQDAYYPTETAHYAHLLLPASQWSEKTGAMTNSERVVTLCPTFRPAPGSARPDWEIFAEVGRRLGFEAQFSFENSAQVYDEFVGLTRGRPCDMSGLSHNHLHNQGPIQWPYPSEEKSLLEDGTMPQEHAQNHAQKHDKRLYTDFRFHTPDGRARFSAFHANGLAEPPTPDYPMVLTTGRLYGHWHTQTRTGRIVKTANMHAEPFLEIHPRDAQRLNVEDGKMVEVRSRRGMARFKAKVTKAIAPGTLFIPMHWGFLWADDAEANALTHPEVCPISLQPELKACAVSIVPLPEDATESGAESESRRQRASVLAR